MMPAFPKVGSRRASDAGELRRSPDRSPALSVGNVNSHDPTLVINNVTDLAKTAKAHGVPTILTTINSKRRWSA
jgi:nicotinamidase-related amidase